MVKKLEVSETKAILVLALPAMLEFGFQTVLQYVDLYMVGVLGVDATSIVGLSSQVQFLLRFPINGMAVGVLSVIAVEFGRKEYGRIHSLSLQTMFYALFVGVIFWTLSFLIGECMPFVYHLDGPIKAGFLSYFRISYSTTVLFTVTVMFGTVLRAIGDMKSPMIINGIVNLLNIILNFFLINKTRYIKLFGRNIKVYGADMGLDGAALGTAVSIAIGGIIMCVVVYCNRKTTIRGEERKIDLAIWKRFLFIGVPAAMTSIATGVGRLIFTSFISVMGTIATAAHSIAFTAESFFYIPAVGIQKAVTTLSGNYLGEGNWIRINKMVKAGTILVMGIMGCMGALLFVFGTEVSTIFTDDEYAVKLSGKVLSLISVSEPLFGLSILMQGILEGMGETRKTFVWSSISMWLFRVVLCFLITRIITGKLEIAWLCMMADNVFRAISLSIVLFRRKYNEELHNRS